MSELYVYSCTYLCQNQMCSNLVMAFSARVFGGGQSVGKAVVLLHLTGLLFYPELWLDLKLHVLEVQYGLISFPRDLALPQFKS